MSTELVAEKSEPSRRIIAPIDRKRFRPEFIGIKQTMNKAASIAACAMGEQPQIEFDKQPKLISDWVDGTEDFLIKAHHAAMTKSVGEFMTSVFLRVPTMVKSMEKIKDFGELSKAIFHHYLGEYEALRVIDPTSWLTLLAVEHYVSMASIQLRREWLETEQYTDEYLQSFGLERQSLLELLDFCEVMGTIFDVNLLRQLKEMARKNNHGRVEDLDSDEEEKNEILVFKDARDKAQGYLREFSDRIEMMVGQGDLPQNMGQLPEYLRMMADLFGISDSKEATKAHSEMLARLADMGVDRVVDGKSKPGCIAQIIVATASTMFCRVDYEGLSELRVGVATPKEAELSKAFDGLRNQVQREYDELGLEVDGFIIPKIRLSNLLFASGYGLISWCEAESSDVIVTMYDDVITSKTRAIRLPLLKDNFGVKEDKFDALAKEIYLLLAAHELKHAFLRGEEQGIKSVLQSKMAKEKISEADNPIPYGIDVIDEAFAESGAVVSLARKEKENGSLNEESAQRILLAKLSETARIAGNETLDLEANGGAYPVSEAWFLVKLFAAGVIVENEDGTYSVPLEKSMEGLELFANLNKEILDGVYGNKRQTAKELNNWITETMDEMKDSLQNPAVVRFFEKMHR